MALRQLRLATDRIHRGRLAYEAAVIGSVRAAGMDRTTGPDDR